MGWDIDAVNLKHAPEKKLMRMVGESLHLGGIGLVLYLVFLSAEAPWWVSPKRSGLARPVSSVSHTSTSSSSLPGPQLAKRARRLGCLALPQSSLPE